MESPEVKAALTSNEELAGAIGVTATPSFVIGTELITGALDEAGFNEAIAKASAKH